MRLPVMPPVKPMLAKAVAAIPTQEHVEEQVSRNLPFRSHVYHVFTSYP